MASHAAGSPAAGTSVDSPPSISADGRFVVFASLEGTLDPTVHGAYQSAYLYDRTSGTVQWVAPDVRGDIPHQRRWRDHRLPQRLPSGRRDRSRTTTSSTSAPGASGPSPSATPSRRPGETGASKGSPSSNFALSADGRYAAFASDGLDLVAGEIPPPPLIRQTLDVFLFDRVTGSTALVSHAGTSSLAATGQARGCCSAPTVRRVAFTSDSTLADGDFNERSDAYLFDLDASAPGGGLVTLPPCTLFDGAAQRSNVRKVLTVAGSCGVPSGASRVTVKVTARQGTAAGNLRLYPGNVTAPPSGTLRFVKTNPASATFDLPLATNGTGTRRPPLRARQRHGARDGRGGWLHPLGDPDASLEDPLATPSAALPLALRPRPGRARSRW